MEYLTIILIILIIFIITNHEIVFGWFSESYYQKSLKRNVHGLPYRTSFHINYFGENFHYIYFYDENKRKWIPYKKTNRNSNGKPYFSSATVAEGENLYSVVHEFKNIDELYMRDNICLTNLKVLNDEYEKMIKTEIYNRNRYKV